MTTVGLEHLGPVQEGQTVPVWGTSQLLTAGTYRKTVTLASEGCIFALWVENCTGTVKIDVSTLTVEGRELPTTSFPILTAGTTNLLIKQAGLVLSRIIITIVVTGTASLDFSVKATSTGPLTVSGTPASTARAASVVAVGSPSLLVPISPLDRSGIILKNMGPASVVYIGFTPTQATLATGWPIAIGETIALSLASGQNIYAVTSSGSADVRILEASV